ncbi:MAG TPA: HD-GYP domain-containing protein [Candidatus Dormibacteraeota bacterium]|nr:HD-GYP domain-containing protein [Candidatus Dormibacteraeota bacterium]
MRLRLRRRQIRRDADRDPSAAQRWRRRPLLAFCLRVLVFLAPIAATLAVSVAVSRALPAPVDRWHEALWWTAVGAVSLIAFLVTDRLCRRALPLVALLQLSMLFPDRAPRRFKVARGRGRVRELTAELERAVDRDPADPATRGAATVLTLIASLTVHDGRTRGHSERVRIFADMIAEEMGIPEEARYRLRWAALLHDIGKLEVPASILNKPGRPDDDEWVQLRRHPETAARLLSPLHGWLGVWMLAAEQHHEHYDGTGYPRRLRGEEISLGGRIVCVADCFETMTAARPYKRTMSAVGAREELVRNAGTQFDPVVCRAFLNISLGRLWRGLGFAAWLGQLPLLTPFAGTLSRWGGQAASMTATLATGAVLAASGLLAIPDVGFGGVHTPAVSRLPARPAPAPAPGPAPVPVPAPAPELGLPPTSTPVLPPPAPAVNGAVVGITGALPGSGGIGGPPPTPTGPLASGRATGDAYALLGATGLPGLATVGPVAPASASAPSPGRPTARSSAAGCGPGAAACPLGIDEVSLGGSSTLATTESGRRADCGEGPPPAGFETGPLAPPAAAACTSGLRVVALSAPLGLLADGIAAESVTQGCSLAPSGHASVRDLQIGGRHLAGGPIAPAPDTRLTVPLAGEPAAMLVVLDEQIPDPGGRGLTVNAVHLTGGPVDLVIGHVHSAVGCAPAAAMPGAAGAGLLAVLLPLLVAIRGRIGPRRGTIG